MTDQLREWQGAFGEAYTDRNHVDYRTRVPGFTGILDDLTIDTALEVGCNRGHNLRALTLLGIEASGIEPQPYARALALADGLDIIDGDVYDIRVLRGSYDLVLCCGVLIHVPSFRLRRAMNELTRVARRYVLSIEYADPAETEVKYRGIDRMLWKRDYGALWAARDDVKVIRTGELGPVWDDATYWLMETT